MSGMSSKKSDLNLVWIDMEMTGLNPFKDHILEVACLVTNGNLDIIAELPTVIIHQPDHVLKSMNEWCVEHHTKSGLVDASLKSKISIQDAECEIVDFLKMYTSPGKCPLAGSSVYIDRMFMSHHMPLVDQHMHYRIVDVSSIKELCRRWHPDHFQRAPVKQFNHRALMDIKESIEELQYYRRVLFPSK